MSFSTIGDALDAFKLGEFVVVVDDAIEKMKVI